MENLSQELVERICDFLPVQDLKNTLTISRSFQYASERASEAFTTFELGEDNVDEFRERYTGRRWRYLKHLKFQTHLPTYTQDDSEEPDEKNHCRESSQELEEKDRIFTDQIHLLFKTIKELEEGVSQGRLQLTIYAPVRTVHTICPHRRCVSWRLHLLSTESLPKIGSVHALSIENPQPVDSLVEEESLLKIDLRVLIDLAVKFPRLEFLGCKLEGGSAWTTALSEDAPRHYSRIWAGPLRDTRADFAKAVENASLPTSLRQAQLDFFGSLYGAERIDQSEPLPNLTGPQSHDPLSSSLRLLSLGLRRLELKAVADSTLLWPADGNASYPNLESICIVLHMASPSGHWYFKGPDGEGQDYDAFEVGDDAYPPLEDTDEDRMWDNNISDFGLVTENVTTEKFRVEPNDDVLTPFVTSFAKAAYNMPALKEACLWTPLIWDADEDEYGDGSEVAEFPDNPLAWGITYIAPGNFGFHPFPGQHYADVRQLWWTTGKWRPSDELRHLFHQIGDQSVELAEYWGHERYGDDKLASRPIFDEFQIYGSRHPENPWHVG